MKKKLLIPITAAQVLTACTGTFTGAPPEPKITGSYTCECSVKTNIIPPGEDEKSETEFAFGGTLIRLGSGFWEMELKSPETLRGMKISSFDGDVTSSLENMSLDLKAEDIPESSPVFALFASLDRISASLERGSSLSPGESGGWCFNEEGVAVTFDSTGCPVSLAAARPAITAEFTSFELYTYTSPSSVTEETMAVTEAAETSRAQTTVTETASLTRATSALTVTETTAVSHSSAVSETQTAAVTTVVTTVPPEKSEQ